MSDESFRIKLELVLAFGHGKKTTNPHFKKRKYDAAGARWKRMDRLHIGRRPMRSRPELAKRLTTGVLDGTLLSLRSHPSG